MSNHNSEVKQAAENVNPQEVEQVLADAENGESANPEELKDIEKTPFMEDDLRTDTDK